MSLILLGILNSQVSPAAAGAYDLLESTVLTSSASSVSFTGLDSYSSYKHLQVRFTVRDTNAAGGSAGMLITFNSDSGSNYSRHGLQGNGSSVSSTGAGSETATQILDIIPQDGSPAGTFGAGVIDILDFSSTTKNTTMRSLNGFAATANKINLSSGGYFQTSAITSVEFITRGTAFKIASRFSLYGVK